ncbi:uncharacterized protein LOC124417503 isoform X1 [Gallus gallus]|uniref:uncharacterized protein LOC124417503 isoform X1 n=1 Tax=Gallus gallus TaxID=9031 RepID=UPI001F011AE4|nr:uncharacterized protein LOC124417503 isoform X1 [Gallus gallus]
MNTEQTWTCHHFPHSRILPVVHVAYTCDILAARHERLPGSKQRLIPLFLPQHQRILQLELVTAWSKGLPALAGIWQVRARIPEKRLQMMVVLFRHKQLKEDNYCLFSGQIQFLPRATCGQKSQHTSHVRSYGHCEQAAVGMCQIIQHPIEQLCFGTPWHTRQQERDSSYYDQASSLQF